MPVTLLYGFALTKLPLVRKVTVVAGLCRVLIRALDVALDGGRMTVRRRFINVANDKGTGNLLRLVSCFQLCSILQCASALFCFGRRYLIAVVINKHRWFVSGLHSRKCAVTEK